MKGCLKSCLIIFVTPLVCLLLLNLVPYLYRPPALTNEKLQVYSAVVNFIKTHRHVGRIRLYSSGRVGVNTVVHWSDSGGLSAYYSKPAIQRINTLCTELERVNCHRAESEGEMILFYPRYSYIAPHPAGVLYSLDGRDPNLVGGPLVVGARPFRRLRGNWYTSKEIAPPRYGGW